MPGTANRGTDQLELGLHCMSSLLCRLTAVQAACRPHTHHRPRCRIARQQAERQPGQAAQQAAAAQERCTLHFAMQLHRPPCHALLLRRLSALQSNSLTQQHCIGIASQFAVVQCTQCLPMHSAMHSNRLKPASTQLRPHSALHHSCIAGAHIGA